jgi:hypothetical protein
LKASLFVLEERASRVFSWRVHARMPFFRARSTNCSSAMGLSTTIAAAVGEGPEKAVNHEAVVLRPAAALAILEQ